MSRSFLIPAALVTVPVALLLPLAAQERVTPKGANGGEEQGEP